MLALASVGFCFSMNVAMKCIFFTVIQTVFSVLMLALAYLATADKSEENLLQTISVWKDVLEITVNFNIKSAVIKL